MKRRIDLLDIHHMVTLVRTGGQWQMTVGKDAPRRVVLTEIQPGEYQVQADKKSARVKLAVKGNEVYIRAFDRTFSLCIVNPVEQAAQESGIDANRIYAPMPGTVVDIAAAEGARVERGQNLMTIESMKILTVLTAAQDAKVEKVHVKAGQSFDHKDILITLSSTKDIPDAPH